MLLNISFGGGNKRNKIRKVNKTTLFFTPFLDISHPRLSYTGIPLYPKLVGHIAVRRGWYWWVDIGGDGWWGLALRESQAMCQNDTETAEKIPHELRVTSGIKQGPRDQRQHSHQTNTTDGHPINITTL